MEIDRTLISEHGVEDYRGKTEKIPPIDLSESDYQLNIATVRYYRVIADTLLYWFRFSWLVGTWISQPTAAPKVYAVHVAKSYPYPNVLFQRENHEEAT